MHDLCVAQSFALFQNAINSPPHAFVSCRFHENSFQLHVRDGDKSDGNSGCDPPEALQPQTVYRVKIELRDKSVAVYVNDEQVCTEAREDRAVYKKAIVYAADPCVQGFVFEG